MPRTISPSPFSRRDRCGGVNGGSTVKGEVIYSLRNGLLRSSSLRHEGKFASANDDLLFSASDVHHRGVGVSAAATDLHLDRALGLAHAAVALLDRFHPPGQRD